uniref:Transmembrane 9 superfamily member n=1 Tax=Echeneis naucrates TaxID=173247 RepID=A0A665UDW9_ECHNA
SGYKGSHLSCLELVEQADNLTLYVNTVGPYHNPQETYHYYTLPVCRPEKVHHKSLSLGEVLEGDRMAESLYHIRFRENVEKKTLSEKQVDQLREAIEELYYFEFVLDDIPVWGFVGYIEESGFLRHRLVEYNGNSMIFANVSVKDVKPVPLGEGVGAAVDYSFFPKTLEIINSLVPVVLLFVILMRVPKNDFSRYNVEEENSEYLIVSLLLQVLLSWHCWDCHGTINSAAISFIVLYALTSCVSGYVSGRSAAIILTSSLFSGGGDLPEVNWHCHYQCSRMN